MALHIKMPAMIKAFDDMTKDFPSTEEEVASRWSRAIADFSSAADASMLVFPTINPAKESELKSLFMTSLGSKRFAEDLGLNLQTWWNTMPWAGPGFTGTTIVTAKLVLGEDLLNTSAADFGRVLGEKISNWMKSSVMVVIFNASGANQGTVLVQ